MKLGKMFKGLGKKASGLGKSLKGAVRHAPRAGYSRGGQQGLLGGTTKSAATRAFAPVKARAKAMGSKMRSTGNKAATRAKGTYAADTKSGFAPRKEDFAGDYVGGQSTFADFDSIAAGGKGGGQLNIAKSRPSKGSLMKGRAQSAVNSVKGRAQSAVNNVKGRLNRFKNSKSGFAGLKSNGTSRYDIL